ncbi:DNA polymerase/3'-5' exonuclease PolX [Pandoraea eparura]|jgi:DNA polymerase (family 10)|uniref:DNA-directed DNA polymerase n=1 Tax=Pandoraea eparura TaxID=2508291 RepID=A0A5E4XIU5_9BURK|nr:DNA polymerase/3'-5' exonuclease PolX [Pandoraea eparura]VVE36213.1 DNA polymerase/3'-5' exonuclease PolX [Pandoraea eparura]
MKEPSDKPEALANEIALAAGSRVGATNERIVAIFDEIADLLDVENANPFRVRAYRNAARSIGALTEDVGAMLARGTDLATLPGIGTDLAGKMREIAETGGSELLTRLRRETPGQIQMLLSLPGLGPRRVHRLEHDLNVHTMEDLAAAAREHRVGMLPGFGPRTEQRLLDAVQARLDRHRRFSLDVAMRAVDPLMAHLRSCGAAQDLAVAGSYRRGRDTVGDLDIAVASGRPQAVIHAFLAYGQTRSVISAGSTRASTVLMNDMQVDLRVVPASSYGAALVYLTGSKAHNVALRKMAQARGLKLNEYGVFRQGRKIAGRDEASIYEALGLPWIAPELREDTGELDAARDGKLPHLVEARDIQGDLHVHTNESDGVDSLEAMVMAAGRDGLQYLAITDHSPRLGITHGLNASRLAAQSDAIDALNAKGGLPTILKGIEVDILEDGSLDLPDAVLGRLDLVVGAIHSHFDLPADKQTARLLRAIDHPHFSILAHPFARLIGEREACRFDAVRVFRALAERGACVEANGQPRRLDVWDTGCRLAKSSGVQVSIASDAHRSADFRNLAWGLTQARRGWLEAADVLNTRSLSRLRAILKKTM